MAATDEPILATLEAERQIKGALLRFCRGADRRDYALLRSAFHEDATDDHGAYNGDVDGFISWQQERHRDIPQCMHLLGNCTIEIEGDAAFVETYCHAVIHEPEPEGGFSRTSIGCRYIDRFENRGPGWRIARRFVAYDWIRRETVDSLLPERMPAGLRTGDDLVYRIRDMPAATAQ